MISIIPSVFLHVLRRNLKFMDENAFEHKKKSANDCFSGNITNTGIMRIMDRMTISECYNDEKSRV